MGHSEILAHGVRIEPAFHLALSNPHQLEALGPTMRSGRPPRERPQMKIVKGMCIITSSTNHQRQL